MEIIIFREQHDSFSKAQRAPFGLSGLIFLLFSEANLADLGLSAEAVDETEESTCGAT